MKTCIRLFFLIALYGCADYGSGIAHLYPTNNKDMASGALRLEYKITARYHGEFSVSMPDGEIITGEFNVLTAGTTSSGSIFSSMYGTANSRTNAYASNGTNYATGTAFGTASGSANGYGNTFSSSSSDIGEGLANGIGNRGTSIQCEYLNNNKSNHGYGACQTSKGVIYKMQY